MTEKVKFRSSRELRHLPKAKNSTSIYEIMHVANYFVKVGGGVSAVEICWSRRNTVKEISRTFRCETFARDLILNGTVLLLGLSRGVSMKFSLKRNQFMR